MVGIPSNEREAIRLAENTDDPKKLELLYKEHIDRPSIMKKVVNNPQCQSFIKKEYLDYVLDHYLARYSSVLGQIGNWNDLLDSMKICLQVWNPPREIAPIVEIDTKDLEINEIFQSLSNYKQVILYGSPGTSKTYYAKGLAKTLVGGEEKYDSNVIFVQFHPSYSYEDFVEGLFPDTDNNDNLIFELRDQIFKEMCKKADKSPEEHFVMIIDEINRADLSKVFGEIFSALEYRRDVVKLLYSQDNFSIPSNLYIIGTMNTLDKSTLDIDFAFMRRFKFFEISPSSEILEKLLKDNKVDDELIEDISSTFNDIQEVFPLGHAYFKDIKSKQDLKLLWEHQLKFLLKEFFGELKKEDYIKAKEIFFGGLKLDSD